jgi:small conductance mechanosensitive channel
MDVVVDQISYLFNLYMVPLVWKLLSAVVVWIVGGWLIQAAQAALGRALAARQIDPTLTKYIEGGANITLRVLVVIAILGVLGIETTSFAALLAAVGVAIGAAWAGLLANFAAGVFLIVLRPFKVGDAIAAGGVTGDVREIGLFVTTIDTADNIRVYVGNNKIFSDSIQNFTANPYRRVDVTAQMAHGVNIYDAIQRLHARVVQIPNVAPSPAPCIEILELDQWGAVLAVRPFCSNAHYWQVYFDVNKAIVDVCTEAGYAVPA